MNVSPFKQVVEGGSNSNGFQSGLLERQVRLTQSSFVCVESGFAENADVVGAMNILERGMQILSPDMNRGAHGDRLSSELPSPHGQRRSATGTSQIKPISA